LLDWLACEFMEPVKPLTRYIAEPNHDSTLQQFNASTTHPWSLKHIHRLIVTSAAYRQSSKVTTELYTKDPYNRLVARGPRVRVEAEIVRDIALSASGL